MLGRAATACVKFVSRFLHCLRRSGPAPDNLWLVRQIATTGWRTTLLLRFLRIRVTPDALKRVQALDLPLDERARLFTAAISYINVNETAKTTGQHRTRLADEAIARRAAEFTRVSLFDLGVSDGTASLDLLESLPNLTQAVLADRHVRLYARGPAAFRTFLDGEHRLLGVKILGVYVSLSLSATMDPSKFESIGTLNPLVQLRLGERSVVRFDAARDLLKPPATLIKCANLLNPVYFSGGALRAAAANIGRSLVDGGYLCISQNHARYPQGEAYLILRRQGDALFLAEEKGALEAEAFLRPFPLHLPEAGCDEGSCAHGTSRRPAREGK